MIEGLRHVHRVTSEVPDIDAECDWQLCILPAAVVLDTKWGDVFACSEHRFRDWEQSYGADE